MQEHAVQLQGIITVPGAPWSEAFNITNTPHFNNPVTVLENPSFAHVTSAYGERRIQLGVKLES